MASFPNSVISFTTKNAGDTIQPSHINDLQAEVTAIEDGYLNGTARLNSSASTLASLSVTGGSTLARLQVSGNSTLASSVTFGAIPYIFPSSGGSTGQVLTCVSTSGSTMALEWRAPTTPWTLLKSGSGSDSNASATTVDSVAISGLTAKDSIVIYTALVSNTQATAQVQLYDVTDAQSVGLVSNSPLPAGTAGTVAQTTLMQSQNVNTSVISFTNGRDADAGAALSLGVFRSGITAWTGSWTLGLRHGGVTAGGTLKWMWVVYRVAGQ